MLTYLDRLILKGLVWIMDVLQRDAIELALINVGNAVVLAPLRAATSRFEVIFESIRRKPAEKSTNNSTANTVSILITTGTRDSGLAQRLVRTRGRDKS